MHQNTLPQQRTRLAQAASCTDVRADALSQCLQRGSRSQTLYNRLIVQGMGTQAYERQAHRLKHDVKDMQVHLNTGFTWVAVLQCATLQQSMLLL
jgi:hypothetical protein